MLLKNLFRVNPLYVYVGYLATCLLSVGEELEGNWRNEGLEEDYDYGKLSKNNLRCIEERQALDHFQVTAKRNSSGRFMLRLPFKVNTREVGGHVNNGEM